MKIGLLSDTHGYLDERVYDYFAECDEVWHAGDFGAGVIEKLRAFKPLRGVYGNIDDRRIRTEFPECLNFEIEGLKVLMIHIGGYPGRYTPLARREINSNKPALFISGHSHIVKVMPDKINNLLHVNPGAAGKTGWHKVKTIVRFDVSAGVISEFELIELKP